MPTRLRSSLCMLAFASAACGGDPDSESDSADPTVATAPSSTANGSGSTGDDETTTAPPTTDDSATTDPTNSTDPSTDPTTDPGGSSTGDGADASSGDVVDCSYPEGAVEPMELHGVLWPYSWNTALHADGTNAVLDLNEAPCGDDTNIAWSPHDVLVFVSIPAW